MKTLFFCLIALSLEFGAGAALPYLGTISPKRAVSLSHTMPDLSYYRVEVAPEAPPTNIVTLTITNAMIYATNMVGIPDGPGILGVTAVFTDSEESETVLYRYHLRRKRPARPVATPVAVLSPPEASGGLTNEIQAVRGTNVVTMPPLPLPKDLSSQAEEYERRYGKRRNE